MWHTGFTVDEGIVCFLYNKSSVLCVIQKIFVMKQLLFLLVFPFVVNANDSTKSIGVYTGISNFSESLNYSSVGNPVNNDLSIYKSSISPIFGITLALKKTGDLHNIAIDRLTYNKESLMLYNNPLDSVNISVVGGYSNTRFNTGLSYHYVFRLNKRKAPSWFFGVGVGLGINYSLNKQNSLFAQYFPSTRHDLVGVTSIKPVINYHISSRVFAGISVISGLFMQSISFDKTANPAYPINQQKTISFETFPFNYSNVLQFQVGVRL